MPTKRKAPAKKAASRKAKKADKPKSDKQLRERVFAAAYLANGFNAGEAAIKAGFSHERARVTGCELLARPDVAALVEAGMAARETRMGISGDAIIKRAWDIATADPAEIIRMERGCCRYCYGKDFRYQRTPREQELHRQEWELAIIAKQPSATAPERMAELLEEYDPQGGVGYDPRKDPHPNCPECFGRGEEHVVLADYRDLSPQARLIYNGVKQGKDTLEVRLEDRSSHLFKCGEHMGVFRRKVELTGKDGKPVVPVDALLASLLDQVNGAGTGIDPKPGTGRGK